MDGGGSSKHWCQKTQDLPFLGAWLSESQPPCDSVTVTETHVPRLPGVQISSVRVSSFSPLYYGGGSEGGFSQCRLSGQVGTGRAAGTPDLALLLAYCVIASSLLNSLNPSSIILKTVVIIALSGGLSLEQGGPCKAY